MGSVFNHVGHCVTDVDRSRRFYEDVLGFEFWREFDAPDEMTAQLLGLPEPVGLKAVYLQHLGSANGRSAPRKRKVAVS